MEDMESTASEVWETVITALTTYGLDVIGAIGLLIAGWMVSRWAAGWTKRGMNRLKGADATLSGFISSLVRYLILVVTVVAVLNQFGVETASLIAVLGTAGLAIGLALQGTLSNVAAGVMLLLFRPFKAGDYVEVGGVSGTVESISLFVTELNTPDNVHIVAPNGQIWNTAVVNYSYNATRRVDLLVGIAYEDNIDQAISVVRDLISKDERVHRDPEPLVVVSELADSSVNLTIRIWCASADYWGLKFDMTKAIKDRLDSEGIGIPYPQRTVHVVQGTVDA